MGCGAAFIVAILVDRSPFLRAGLLPFFDLSEISVVTGLQALWGKDVSLALLVTVLAIFVPYLKTIGLVLMQFEGAFLRHG